MDVKDLKHLVKMITETDITEFEMDNAEEKIVIKRGQRTEVVQMAATPTFMSAPVAMPAPAVPAATVQAAAPVAVVDEGPKGETINSPIVGTFYHAASPESDPYVEVGQVVEKGQILCLVEAMKLFNEIEAEFKCKIISICVENAQAVEFGQPLFEIEKL